jgi:hypothetical protein
MCAMQKVVVPPTPRTDGWTRVRQALSAEEAHKGMKLAAPLYEKLKEPAFPGWRRAPLVAPALPEWRLQCGACRLFPSSPRSNLSATRYRLLPCEKTHRRQPRRHGACFRWVNPWQPLHSVAIDQEGNGERHGAERRATPRPGTNEVGTMLRITIHDGPRALTLRLEGRLVGPSVRELKECWRAALAGRRELILRVDLTEVTAIDAAGQACLAALHRQGTEFVAADCLMKAVVAEITGAPVPDRRRPK